MSRVANDPAWTDEVVRRYLRRKHRDQQREQALADLRAALADAFDPIFRTLSRFVR